MDSRHEFRLSIELPPAAQPDKPVTPESLSRFLRGVPDVKVLGPGTDRRIAPDRDGAGEVRGLEVVGLLLGIVSSGAATALVQAIALWFNGTKTGKATVRIHDEKRSRD